LLERVSACESAGIPRELLLLDPGFGFGKTLEHNLQLFRGLPALVGLGLPVLIGVSRKSMIGRILGRDMRQRLAGGLALATLAAQQGVAVVRTHDVRATRDVLAMVAAVRKEG
jgi:dihydropteroate synthase